MLRDLDSCEVETGRCIFDNLQKTISITHKLGHYDQLELRNVSTFMCQSTAKNISIVEEGTKIAKTATALA